MATTRTTALARSTSSIRGVRSSSTTATFLQATRTTRTIRTPSFAAAHSYRQPLIAAQSTQRRLLSTDEPAQPRSYSFSQIQHLSSGEPSEQDPILIDVREPHEFQNGRIPTSQNLPITSSPEGLLLPADEFEERFGFQKPTAAREVVFYCKAGVRSRAAARIAVQAGYQKVGEYQGSWVDWERNGGEVEK